MDWHALCVNWVRNASGIYVPDVLQVWLSERTDLQNESAFSHDR